MTLRTILTILLVIIIGILFLKALRKILSFILMLFLLYFAYYTFFTYPGAVSFALFRKTFSISSYKIDTEEFDEAKTYNFDPSLTVGDYEINSIKCTKQGPTIICDAEGQKQSN